MEVQYSTPSANQKGIGSDAIVDPSFDALTTAVLGCVFVFGVSMVVIVLMLVLSNEVIAMVVSMSFAIPAGIGSCFVLRNHARFQSSIAPNEKSADFRAHGSSYSWRHNSTLIGLITGTSALASSLIAVLLFSFASHLIGLFMCLGVATVTAVAVAFILRHMMLNPRPSVFIAADADDVEMDGYSQKNPTASPPSSPGGASTIPIQSPGSGVGVAILVEATTTDTSEKIQSKVELVDKTDIISDHSDSPATPASSILRSPRKPVNRYTRGGRTVAFKENYDNDLKMSLLDI